MRRPQSRGASRQHRSSANPRGAGGRFAPGLVARVEEATKELKLDDAQKKRIQGGAALAAVLNDNQKAK